MFLNFRFNSSGCTNTQLVAVGSGGVSFKEASPLNGSGRALTFNPDNDVAGCYINDSGALISSLKTLNNFSIYFRYKIHPDAFEYDEVLPIFTYLKTGASYTEYILVIEEKDYFSFYMNEDEYYTTTRIGYTFDNKWHSLYIAKEGDYLSMYVDGNLCGEPYELETKKIVINGTKLFIGHDIELGGRPKSLNGGSLDDICFLDKVVYKNSFVPPTAYFTGEDKITNYLINDESNMLTIADADTVLETERQIRKGTYYFNRFQLDWLPRRCHIEWHQVTRYWRRGESVNTRLYHRRDTVIQIQGLEFEAMFYTEENKYLEGNVFLMYKLNQLQQLFVLFIDNTFIPLSQIDIYRSDRYTNLIIKGRDHDTNDYIKSVIVLTLPFGIIYEENMGERQDLKPLYTFNKKGKFSPASASYFYYIDPTKGPVGDNGDGSTSIGTPGIGEEPTGDQWEDGDDDANKKYMKFIWRFGTLANADNPVTSGSTKTRRMHFYPWAFDTVSTTVNVDPSVTPTDDIILYHNTRVVDPSRYRIVGNDLIEFLDADSLNIQAKDLFTMQIISDLRENNLTLDSTNVKSAWVTATEDKQYVFNIPRIVDTSEITITVDGKPMKIKQDGIEYHKFVVFRGSVCMENSGRYTIDYDNWTIEFTNKDDYVPKGTSLQFVFVKLDLSDQYSRLHIKPIFYYGAIEYYEGYARVRLPTKEETKGLTFNMNNFMLFVQDTFIDPKRYEVINGYVYFVQKGDTMTIHPDSHTPSKSCTIVTLKMVNEFEDPTKNGGRSPEGDKKRREFDRGRRYVLYDLMIDKKYKLTLDNFVCFDQHGEYIPDLRGKIYNMNIIKYLETSEPLKRIPKYLTCVYYKGENLANVVRPNNTDLIKDYIMLYESFYELDPIFDEFMKDFNHRHREDWRYGENLAAALNHIGTYNPNILDRLYERNATCKRVVLDTAGFIKQLKALPSGKYSSTLYANDYFNSYHYRDRIIFFVNGEYALWNKDTTYVGNKITITLPAIPKASDRIEIFRFYRVNNYLKKIKATVK